MALFLLCEPFLSSCINCICFPVVLRELYLSCLHGGSVSFHFGEIVQHTDVNGVKIGYTRAKIWTPWKIPLNIFLIGSKFLDKISRTYCLITSHHITAISIFCSILSVLQLFGTSVCLLYVRTQWDFALNPLAFEKKRAKTDYWDNSNHLLLNTLFKYRGFATLQFLDFWVTLNSTKIMYVSIQELYF